MQYLENLGEPERFIIREIVNSWDNDFSDTSYDSKNKHYGINLYKLIDDVCRFEDQPYVEEIHYSVDPESGEVDIYQFYDLNLVKKVFGEHQDEALRNFAEKRKYSIIASFSFIYQLFKDGLIYFSDEEFEDTKFEEWAIPFDKYPSPQYLYELGFFVSLKISKLINRYLGASIIPSCYLIDFFKNDFETTEQRRFKKQQKDTELALAAAKEANDIARESNKIAKRAIGISLAIAIGSILCAIFAPVNIHKSFTEQLNYRLDKMCRIDSIYSNAVQDINAVIDSIQSSVNRLQIQQNIKQTNNGQTENAKP